MITLDLAKQQLNVIGTDQDALIALYLANAKKFVELHCDRTIVESPTDKPEEMEYDGVIGQAILQLVGMFYRDREDQPMGGGGSPYTTVIDRLLWTKKRF